MVLMEGGNLTCVRRSRKGREHLLHRVNPGQKPAEAALYS